MAGAFVICPCHLPITLWLLGGLLAGTTAGAMVHSHPIITGTTVTAIWSAATWHGMQLMNARVKL